MNCRFQRVLRALFAGLAAATVSSCGGGGGNNADGGAPSAPPSASTTISVDSAFSVAAISQISSPLGVLISGQKTLDIPIRPDGTSDTILLATNANDDVLLAAFAGPNGTTTLSSASTALVMTRAALETLPEPGPSTAQISAMILSAGGYAELVAAIDAAVQAGDVPMKSLRVQDSLRVVVSQVRSAILHEFPQAAVASTGEARSASRPRILAATPPPLPFRLVDTPSFPALTVDNGDGGLINIRNFSLIDWRVQSKGLDGAVINGIFLPALDIWKSPFTSLVVDTKLSPPVPLQGSGQFIVTAFPDADSAATQMVNAIISLAKTPFSSALPNTALNSSCVSAIILPLVSSQLGALLVHPSDATLNDYFAGFFNSPRGTNSLLAAIKKCTPVFTRTAVDAYLNYLSKGNKFIATIAFVPDIMATNARIKQIALFTGTTASVEICMTGSVITPCSIVIDPATPFVPVGRTLQLTALMGTDRLPYPSGGALTWADLSNPYGASIDASTGLLQGVGTMENGISVDHITVSNPWGDVANVDVTVYLPRIAEVGAGAPGGVAILALIEGGQSKFLQLIDPSGKPADIKPSYVWAAFDDKFLVVNGATGEIKARVAGDTDVTATDPLTGTKISAPVHITPAPTLSIDPGNVTLTLGDTQLLLIVEGGTPPTNPSASRFDWTSSHPEVATVDPTGLVVANGAGVTTISAADRMSTRTALAVVTIATPVGYWVVNFDIKKCDAPEAEFPQVACNPHGGYGFDSSHLGQFGFATGDSSRGNFRWDTSINAEGTLPYFGTSLYCSPSDMVVNTNFSSISYPIHRVWPKDYARIGAPGFDETISMDFVPSSRSQDLITGSFSTSYSYLKNSGSPRSPIYSNGTGRVDGVWTAIRRSTPFPKCKVNPGITACSFITFSGATDCDFRRLDGIARPGEWP